MKTILSAAMFSIFTSATSAHSGIYAGLALGGNQLSGTQGLAIKRHATDPHNYGARVGDKSFSGEIFAGYGQSIYDIWLAVEGHFGLSSLETKALLDISGLNSQQPLHIKSDNGYGIDLIAGYPINPTSKGYIKLGVESRKFHTAFQAHNSHGDPLVSHNKDYRTIAFAPGIGIETEISPIITVRSEFRTAFHPEKTHHTTGAGLLKTSVKSKPVIHHFHVGFHIKM